MSPATRWIVVTLALVLALAAPARPAAALDIYLRLFPESGPEIQGDSEAAAEPNAINLISVAVPSVQTPVDVSTIRATGRTQWTGLTLTKRFDRSSPRLLQALIRPERFARAEVRFYNQDTRVRTWTLDGGVFVLGLASGASATVQAGVDIVEQLQLWSCRISFRDHVSGRVGGVDFCNGSPF